MNGGAVLVVVVFLVILLVLIVGISAIAMYNKFVSQRNTIEESWRQIDVELKRRYDLIPQLVETVKGYASHERQVLTELSRLRSAAAQAPAGPSAERTQAEQQISQQLRSLMVQVEAYPDLKANQNFLHLQKTLSDTEDRIAAGRRFYNANVRAYNTRLQTFPSSIVGGMFHFEAAQYFELDDEAAREMPQVDFDTSSYGAQPVQDYAGSQQRPGQLPAPGAEAPIPGQPQQTGLPSQSTQAQGEPAQGQQSAPAPEAQPRQDRPGGA